VQFDDIRQYLFKILNMSVLRKRQLGRTGPLVTRVGHGLWVIGGIHWGGADDGKSVAAIQVALEQGVTLFDTAPVYGFGHSETLLGKALTGRREEVIVATKCGLDWDDRGRIKHDNRPQRVRDEIEQSIRRIGREPIDVYQIHWPDPEVPVEETVGTLRDLQVEGKIRWIGVSNFDVSLLKRAQTEAEIISVQVPYNILRRGLEEELLPYCLEQEIGVLGYEPLCRGLFSGKFNAESRFPRKDLRSRDPRFEGDAFQQRLDLVDALEIQAESLGLSVAQLAVAFSMEQKSMTSVLCGARTGAQIKETSYTARMVLPEGVRQLIMSAVNDLGLEDLDC
jgi:aryl-alcohol dehydrogenase-like predicted oxidoreductase